MPDQTKLSPPQLAVITCAVLEDEVKHFSADLPQVVHTEIMQQGLHNEPHELRRQVQAAIDRVERDLPHIQAIVLGYGLCSRGTEGITTGRCLLVIPRAHVRSGGRYAAARPFLRPMAYVSLGAPWLPRNYAVKRRTSRS